MLENNKFKEYKNYDKVNKLWNYFNESSNNYGKKLLEYIHSKGKLELLTELSTLDYELENEIVKTFFPEEIQNLWFDRYSGNLDNKHDEERYNIMELYMIDKSFDNIKNLLDKYIDSDQGPYTKVTYKKKK
jgi:hypothetical protein